MKELFIVESQEGERIDRYLAEALPERSRSYVQKLIKEGHVLVNGEPVKASYRLLIGDCLAITMPEVQEPDIGAEEIPLDILYEDSSISRNRWWCIRRRGIIPVLWSMGFCITVDRNCPVLTV